MAPKKELKAGTPLIAAISTGCTTPELTVKFSNLVKAFYYSNSPTIPRYSITCIVDPIENKEFLDGLMSIEKNEKVDSIIKAESAKVEGETVSTGKFLVKFQTKELIPVYTQPDEEGNSDLVVLEDELPKGSKVTVVYDILRYTKKGAAQVEHGLSFRPSKIFIKSEKK